MHLYLFLVGALLLLLLQQPPTAYGQEDNLKKRERRFRRNGWRKFGLIVGGSFSLIPPPNNNNRDPDAGDMLLGDNPVRNLRLDEDLGRAYQTCIFPNDNPDVGTPSEFNWDCTFTFTLRFRNSRPGQIMAQGLYYRSGTAPLDDLNTPEKQFITITGGTGTFAGITGIIRIETKDLDEAPPLWEFTFYFRIEN